MAKKACWLLEIHASSERETFPSSFYHDNRLIVNTLQGETRIRSYLEHFTKSFNCFLTHLHHTMLDALTFWHLQQTTKAMSESHHCNKFGFFDLIEWLVACDNPFCEESLKFFLVPWSLLNGTSDTSNQRGDFHLLWPTLADLQTLS